MQVLEPFLLHVDSGCVGAIIGKQGATIRQLQASSGAMIVISPLDGEYVNGKEAQEVLISGDLQQIDTARTSILDLVHSLQWSREAENRANVLNWFHKIKQR